uniref:phosphoribosyl-ATP diphosphatase n=1 Tax=Sphingomonas sp. PSPC2-2 TaxID=2804576 RepID=UPI003CF59610
MNAVVALLPARPAGTNTTCANTIFANDLEQLYNALNDVTLTEHARTAELMNAGLRKISQKVVEEAAEVALEAVRKRTQKTVSESADLLYHLVVLWHALNIEPSEVWAEMRRRVESMGIAEKLRECQEFRVRAGIMGKKEPRNVPTQRACDTERSAGSAAGWR